jgi:CHASE3 domain sensor protein
MRKKIFIVLAGSVLFLFGITFHLAAQKIPQASQQEPRNFDIIANLQNVQIQITALASSVGTGNQQVLNKLDQVLSNQDKILKELDVVRVRVSRNR